MSGYARAAPPENCRRWILPADGNTGVALTFLALARQAAAASTAVAKRAAARA